MLEKALDSERMSAILPRGSAFDFIGERLLDMSAFGYKKSGIRESDPLQKLGKLLHYRCANAAGKHVRVTHEPCQHRHDNQKTTKAQCFFAFACTGAFISCAIIQDTRNGCPNPSMTHQKEFCHDRQGTQVCREAFEDDPI